MKKYLVNIYIPSIYMSYDILVTPNKRVDQLIELVKKGICELDRTQVSSSELHTLCRRRNGTIYLPQYSIDQAGIQNGEQLILF